MPLKNRWLTWTVSSKSLTKHFKRFGSGFTELPHRTWCRQNETWSWKRTRVKTVCAHSMVSHGRLMQWAFGSVNLASLLIVFHWGSYNNNSLEAFQYHLICLAQCFFRITIFTNNNVSYNI
jgi:hypothetical protein